MTAAGRPTPGRVVVIGGLNMDIHLFGLRSSSGQAPLVAERHLAQPGGKGANVARAVARLDAEVLLVGRVGDDDFGRECVRAVTADGADASGVIVTAGVSTGFVAIELTEGKHRSLVFAPGANDHLCWPDIEPHVSPLGPSDMVIVQAEIPSGVLSELTRLANELEVPLLLDPTPPELVRRDHLAGSEIITPDLLEASQLVGRTNASELWPMLAARELLELGARRAVIKTGESGAVFADESGVFQIPTLHVEVLDETGAGDVFLAALAIRRLEGGEWEPAIRFANAASALSVSGAGLMLPDRAAVDRAHQQLDLLSPPWG
jgi:ribokinase